MNLPIYKQEIADGLVEQLSNNSIACYAVARCGSEDYSIVNAEDSLLERLGIIAKAENKDQIDLFYLKSVLVSTGWNKNDDVFDPRELWAARNTPEDKPFNFMHDESDIIGHITSNEVVDFEGNPIEEGGEVPSQFNILTSAVIYTEWSDPEQRGRMNKIVAEIGEGKWFVSMECLFPNFDYALTRGGETQVIPRNESSAFLTKHLRSYGGDGKYEDYKVGRLLRNLSFSGKGLVSKPANPRSIILEGNDFFDESQSRVLSLSSLKEKNMSDNHETQISDLRAELAEAKAANEAMQEQVVAEQQAEFTARIDSLEATIAQNVQILTEVTEAKMASEARVEELESSLAAKDKEMSEKEAKMKEKEEELAAMKKKEAMMKRKAQLEEVGFDAEQAEATLADFEDLDEETFKKIVATFHRRPVMWAVQETQEVVEETEAEEAPEVEEISEEIDTAEAEAVEEVLEVAEEVQEAAIAESMGEEVEETLRSIATAGIENFYNAK